MIQIDKNHFTISNEEKRLGYYGDNCVTSLTFNISENTAGCDFVLCLSFPNGSVNMINLEKSGDNKAIWNIRSEHLLCSGRVFMQLKAISSTGEIWHSPKAEAVVYSSIEEDGITVNTDTSLADRLEEAVKIINESNEIFITRSELIKIIDELLLPLCRRLDGE